MRLGNFGVCRLKQRHVRVYLLSVVFPFFLMGFASLRSVSARWQKLNGANYVEIYTLTKALLLFVPRGVYDFYLCFGFIQIHFVAGYDAHLLYVWRYVIRSKRQYLFWTSISSCVFMIS